MPSRELTILGACATPVPNTRQRARLSALLNGPVNWDELVTLAEHQNMSGLAALHLVDAGTMPDAVRLRMIGLRMRRRELTRVQEDVIVRILDVANRLRIETMLLKGAALRRVVYPEPDLRAMRDVDVLVRPEEGQRLYDALVEAGFARVDHATHPLHYPVLMWRQEGFDVGVEIHWMVHARWRAGLDELAARGTTVSVRGRTALTPSPADLFRHAFLHCFGSHLWLGSRLVAVADLVAMMERWAGAAEAHLTSSADRRMLRALGWLDLFAPMSDAARAHMTDAPFSEGVGEFYEGWPLESGSPPLASWAKFRATFFPSPWFLRLRYRARGGPLPLAWASARHFYDLFEVWK